MPLGELPGELGLGTILLPAKLMGRMQSRGPHEVLGLWRVLRVTNCSASVY